MNELDLRAFLKTLSFAMHEWTDELTYHFLGNQLISLKNAGGMIKEMDDLILQLDTHIEENKLLNGSEAA